MKIYIIFYSLFATCFLICPLYASNVPQGTLMWDLNRHTSQWIPDVMINQALVGSGGFTITRPGTYALAENISFTATDGIIIASSDVFFDLNGHTITGGGGVSNGIVISPGLQNIVIRNGTLVNCQGVSFTADATTQLVIIDHLNCYVGTAATGIDASLNGTLLVIRDCTVRGGVSSGILAGTRSWVQRSRVSNVPGFGFSGLFSEFDDCIAELCTFRGFSSSTNDVFRRCKASNCGTGFEGGTPSVECEECIANNNTSHGFSNTNARGIYKNCVSYLNGGRGFSNGVNSTDSSFEDCIALGNTGDGFFNAAADVTILASEAHNNTGIGINDTTVVGTPKFFNNLSYSNTGGQYTANIPIQASLSTITTGTGYWSNVFS